MKTGVRSHSAFPWSSLHWWFFSLCLCAQSASAQSVRSLVNGGNDFYHGEKYTDAEVSYRKALEKEQGLVQGHFNLGDALHKQGKFDEAVKEYETAMNGAEQKDTKAFAHYNIGNSLMKEQRYQDAVRSYIDALKLNPNDEDTKYNLSYALEKLKQQQQQQKQQQNKDDKKKDKDKKDQQQQQNKQQQDKQQQDKQQQDKQQQDKQKQQQQQQLAQQQKRMSKADAQRILEVLKNSEKDVQKKLHARQAVRPKTDKDW